MRANRKDANHKELVAHAQSLGFGTMDVSMMKNFCDEIWIRNSHTFFVEIKDGSKPPSQIMLTEGEKKFKIYAESIGAKWRLILNQKDVNELFKETL